MVVRRNLFIDKQKEKEKETESGSSRSAQQRKAHKKNAAHHAKSEVPRSQKRLKPEDKEMIRGAPEAEEGPLLASWLLVLVLMKRRSELLRLL